MTFRVSWNGCIRKLNCLSVTFCLIANWQTKFSFSMFPLDIFHWKLIWRWQMTKSMSPSPSPAAWPTCVSLPTWDLLNYHWTENLTTDSLTETRPGEAAPGSSSAGYWQYWPEQSCHSCSHEPTLPCLYLASWPARTPSVILLQDTFTGQLS